MEPRTREVNKSTVKGTRNEDLMMTNSRISMIRKLTSNQLTPSILNVTGYRLTNKVMCSMKIKRILEENERKWDALQVHPGTKGLFKLLCLFLG
jgi:hypothetical protein